MKEIVDTITEWPVIVQGALGSGMFWLILTILPKVWNGIITRFNSEKHIANSFGIIAHQAVHDGDHSRSTTGFLFCIYGAIHYLTKAFLILYLSSLFSSGLYVFELVGKFIGIYLIFRALSYVPHSNSCRDTTKISGKSEQVGDGDAEEST